MAVMSEGERMMKLSKIDAEPAKPVIARIATHGVSVRFESKGRTVTAVDGIDFSAADGEFVAVVGPSGSGKSTFLMALDGLIPLSDGEVRVDGMKVNGPGRDRAVVFQDASLLPWRTVLGNVSYGLELAGKPRRQRLETAQELIELAGLQGFERHFPAELSGGMRQRANIARALAADPEVLLLDEPFSGLDAMTRETMQAELLKIWEEKKKTAIFVTHQIDEAVYLADRVVAFSARPARIVQEWTIPFERPRPLDLKQSKEHHALEDDIWRVVRREGFSTAESGQ